MAEAAVAEKKPEAPASKPRFTAKLRYARISARKMRYVVDLVRGKDYNNAIAILRACSKRGAMFCKKLLESAYGNAINIAREKNLDIDGNKLHLIEAHVDPGPIIKRWRPSSVRRPNMIKKRLCHVVFTLEERDLKESRPEKAKRHKQERQKQQQAQKAAAAPAKPAGAAAPGAAGPKADAAPKQDKGKAKPADEGKGGKEEKK
jgi:large subunit ribosomal protein L22